MPTKNHSKESLYCHEGDIHLVTINSIHVCENILGSRSRLDQKADHRQEILSTVALQQGITFSGISRLSGHSRLSGPHWLTNTK